MTDHIEDGGPAFAQEQWNPDHEMFMVTGGATLRDYFAAEALAALIGADKDYQNRGGKAVPTLAKWSYEYADAMLKARKS